MELPEKSSGRDISKAIDLAPKVDGAKDKEKEKLYERLETIKVEPNFAVLNTKRFEEVYQLGKPLGKGSFGLVYECTLLSSIGKQWSLHSTEN